jgi:hypothetical protein
VSRSLNGPNRPMAMNSIITTTTEEIQKTKVGANLHVVVICLCFPCLVAVPLVLSSFKSQENKTPLLICEFLFYINLCSVVMNLLGLTGMSRYRPRQSNENIGKYTPTKYTHVLSCLAGCFAYVGLFGFLYQYNFLSPSIVFVCRTIRLFFNTLIARILYNYRLSRSHINHILILILSALTFQIASATVDAQQRERSVWTQVLGFGSAFLSNLFFACSYALDTKIQSKTPAYYTAYPVAQKDLIVLCLSTIGWLTTWGLFNQFQQSLFIFQQPTVVVCTSILTALSFKLAQLLVISTSAVTLDLVSIMAVIFMYGIALILGIEQYSLGALLSFGCICIVIWEYRNLDIKQK